MNTQHFYSVAITAFALLCVTNVSRAEEAKPATRQWEGIQRLDVNLSSTEVPPFLEMLPPGATETPVHAPLKTRSASEPALAQNNDLAFKSTAVESTAAGESKAEQMRSEIIKDGQAAIANRDNITSEFFGVIRWTIVMIAVGICVALGLKKLPQFQNPQKPAGRMNILETLSLGRHQSLNLIEAAGEKFLVASDAGGIKSVTLLPNWPGEEVEETGGTNASDLKVFDSPSSTTSETPAVPAEPSKFPSFSLPFPFPKRDVA